MDWGRLKPCKMIKVAINAAIINEEQTGLGVYAQELVSALLSIGSPKWDFIVYTSSSSLKRLFPEKVCLISTLLSPDAGLKGHFLRLLWEQTKLPLMLRSEGVSLLYSPAPEGSLTAKLKQIITLHDILPLRYPEIYSK
ncbi:MAG: hypothetical protein ACK40E_05540, partial [Caldimicrobium sp.]